MADDKKFSLNTFSKHLHFQMFYRPMRASSWLTLTVTEPSKLTNTIIRRDSYRRPGGHTQAPALQAYRFCPVYFEKIQAIWCALIATGKCCNVRQCNYTDFFAPSDAPLSKSSQSPDFVAKGTKKCLVIHIIANSIVTLILSLLHEFGCSVPRLSNGQWMSVQQLQ